ncbi:unnamed protein product [Colias eurytheme]|nr:unnamed protein product [Colias eurytheme]
MKMASVSMRLWVVCNRCSATRIGSKVEGCRLGGTVNPDLAGEGYSYYGLPPPDGARSTPEHHLHSASTFLNVTTDQNYS